MSTELYVRLSAMMFLQFAVWGAWSPVLAARLLGPLKMSGKQTGWIYGTLFLAAIVSPLVGGLVADRWVNTEYFLVGAHLLGAVLLFLAAKQTTFKGLFIVMGLYALCYAPTLALVPSLMFHHLRKAFPNATWATIAGESGKIYIWAPIAWTLVGWLLTGLRRLSKEPGDGSDCLKMAGALSVLMAVACFFLPATPPAKGDVLPFIKAFRLLGDPNFLIFLIVSFVVFTQLQFYFLGTAQYLGDLGVQSKNVPAAMAIAQAAQAAATWFALSLILGKVGFPAALAAGALAWTAMYIIYAIGRPKALVVASMALHGIAYVLFVVIGQIYVDNAASPDIRASAQALLAVATMGLGLFLGAQFAGRVMDRFREEGKFQWRPIFLVPCSLVLAAAIVLAAFFKFKG